MKHFYDLNGVVSGKTCIAFGSFDGIHLGHRAVIGKLHSCAGLTPVIVSFCDEVNPIIYSEQEKEYLLQDKQVEVMISLPKMEIDSMTGEAFIREILVSKLQMKAVVVGEGIRFGCDNAGMELLKKLGEELDFEVEAVPTVCYDGKPVTTDDIRQAIADGDFERMTALLGETYIMQGTVVHGKAAGRKHGMPTANLGVAKNKLFPPHGVYGTLSCIEGAFLRGVTNIGLRPSDDSIPVATVETWLMNFSCDIYGKRITLKVYKYIRGVMKFANLDEVRKQIDKDVMEISEYLDDLVAKMKR